MSDSYAAVLKDLVATVSQMDAAAKARDTEVAGIVKVLAGAAMALMQSHPDPDSLRAAWAAHVDPLNSLLPETEEAGRALLVALTASLGQAVAH